MEFCDTRLCVQSTLGIVLGILVLTQGTVLNYYIISHNASSTNSYFFFLGDFFCIFMFAGTLTIAFRYLNRCRNRASQPASRTQSFNFSPKRFISNYPTSKLGILPLLYISWLLYAGLLLSKIVFIFLSNIPDNLSTQKVAGPQLLKVAIALAGIVFLILVEGHNWAERGTPRYIYATSICAKTGIEVLDTVSFLSIIITGSGDSLPTYELTPAFETVIVLLSAANFLLPALVLYKLSLEEGATESLPLPLTVLHTLLHVCLIDIPFLAIRLYLWIVFHHNSSIFMMKNVFGIIFSIRGIYPDIHQKPRVHDIDEFLSSEKGVPLKDVVSNKGNHVDEIEIETTNIRSKFNESE